MRMGIGDATVTQAMMLRIHRCWAMVTSRAKITVGTMTTWKPLKAR